MPICRNKTIVVAVYVFMPLAPAYAYVDPGSGMLAVQSLVALIGAVVVFMKNPITVIRALITRRRKK